MQEHQRGWADASDGEAGAEAYVNFGSQRPARSVKKRGTKVSPLSSRLRRSSRSRSSTADFASVAASMSLATIACVSFCHCLDAVDEVSSQATLFCIERGSPSRFVRLLLVLRRDELGRYVLAVLGGVE